MLLDDHEVVRQGLKTLLERRPGLSVVADAGSVAEALAKARRCRPDVIVMDVRLPDGSGIEACREIRAENPGIRVVLLTSSAAAEAVLVSILAGASGYLLKHGRARALVDAIEVLADGGSVLDPVAADHAFERLQAIAAGELPAEGGQLTHLSNQERRILVLIAEGKTNREIAGVLALPEETVKICVRTILEKFGMGYQARTVAAAPLVGHVRVYAS